MCCEYYEIWIAYFERSIIRGSYILEHMFVIALAYVIHAQALAMMLLDPYNVRCPMVGKKLSDIQTQV